MKRHPILERYKIKPHGFTSRQTVSAVCRRMAYLGEDVRGQDVLEWAVGLPIFLILCAGIAFYAWTWWNQTTAAAAIHDGTYLAAIQGGDIGAGQARVQQMLRAAVGRFATRYEYSLTPLSGSRSVSGLIRNPSAVNLPFLGRMLFGIRASSFQRLEQFYGGPPQGWW